MHRLVFHAHIVCLILSILVMVHVAASTYSTQKAENVTDEFFVGGSTGLAAIARYLRTMDGFERLSLDQMGFLTDYWP